MKRKAKLHRQGQARFRSLIEVVHHYGLFEPLQADDARSVFLMASEPDKHFTEKGMTAEAFDAWLDAL